MEGLRMAEHPDIVFRDGPAGRRPGLAGHHFDVWEIVETFHNEGDDTPAAAVYLGVSPGLVSAAIDYHVDHQSEIDEWIERNRRMAEEAEEAWRRSRNDRTR